MVPLSVHDNVSDSMTRSLRTDEGLVARRAVCGFSHSTGRGNAAPEPSRGFVLAESGCGRSRRLALAVRGDVIDPPALGRPLLRASWKRVGSLYMKRGFGIGSRSTPCALNLHGQRAQASQPEASGADVAAAMPTGFAGLFGEGPASCADTWSPRRRNVLESSRGGRPPRAPRPRSRIARMRPQITGRSVRRASKVAQGPPGVVAVGRLLVSAADSLRVYATGRRASRRGRVVSMVPPIWLDAAGRPRPKQA